MSIVDIEKLKRSNKKTFKGILNMLPIILGMILLVSMLDVLVPNSFYSHIFGGNTFLDALKGASIGSVFTGNPVTGYILGIDFLQSNISLIAITAFLVSWVTVGLIQIPAEMLALGKRFAFYRNITAFFMSILVAIVTVLTLRLL